MCLARLITSVLVFQHSIENCSIINHCVVVVVVVVVVDKYGGNDEGGEKQLCTVIGRLLNENPLHFPNERKRQ